MTSRDVNFLATFRGEMQRRMAEHISVSLSIEKVSCFKSYHVEVNCGLLVKCFITIICIWFTMSMTRKNEDKYKHHKHKYNECVSLKNKGPRKKRKQPYTFLRALGIHTNPTNILNIVGKCPKDRNCLCVNLYIDTFRRRQKQI